MPKDISQELKDISQELKDISQELKDISQELKDIENLREQKGQEDEVIAKVTALLPTLEEMQDWKKVAKMYWELSLVWQHRVMAERVKPEHQRYNNLLSESTAKMMENATKAHEVIVEHGIEDMIGGSYKFLGRSADYAGYPEKAIGYYKDAISNYWGKNEKSKLEVNGLMSGSMILSGSVTEGFNLAKKTYDDMYNSELGSRFRDEDYYVWAVWMSGIAPRTVNALIEAKASYDKEDLLSWLNSTKEELENPSGTHEWRNLDFTIRLESINDAISKLSSEV